MGPLAIAGLTMGASGLLNGISNIFGAKKSSEAAEDARKYQQIKAAYIDEQQKKLDNWHNRNANIDYTQRADAQHVLNYAAEQFKNRNKHAAGTAAVMGGTEEGVAAEKAANAAAMADATAKVAAAGASHRDNVEQQYMQGTQHLNNLKASNLDASSNIEMQRAGNIMNASSNLGSALNGMIGNFASLYSAFK